MTLKPNFDLTGKIAIVTGGASGIGRGLAEAFGKCGASVAIVDINLAGAERTAENIINQGGHARAIETNVTKVQDIKRMMQEVKREFGGLDILVNCAGIVLGGSAIDYSEEDWDSVIDTNLKGTFFCCQAAGEIMIPQGRGKIVNIASQMGVRGGGYPKRVPYGASKGGIIQLTTALAVEWAPYNINVNGVCPTYTITEENKMRLTGEFSNADFRAEFIKTIPLGRAGTPDDLAGAVVFLSSNAADFITGHTILVDGGRTAR